MQSVLHTVYEYQLLLAKKTRLGIDLAEQDEARLVGLRSFLRGDFINAGGKRRHLFAEPKKVEFTTPGGFATGEIHDLCGGGVAIVTQTRARPGLRTVLRVFDESTNCEYTFPSRVVWRDGHVLGIAFDGVPSRADLLGDKWSDRFSLGRRVSRPLVA